MAKLPGAVEPIARLPLHFGLHLALPGRTIPARLGRSRTDDAVFTARRYAQERERRVAAANEAARRYAWGLQWGNHARESARNREKGA